MLKRAFKRRGVEAAKSIGKRILSGGKKRKRIVSKGKGLKKKKKN